MSKRNPDEIAAGHDPVTPDQPAGKPTGAESTTKQTPPAAPKPTPEPAAEEEVVEQMQQVAAEYYEKLADLTADFSEQARGYLTDGRDFAREHPGSTILGGFALGVIVGALLGRN